jgi:hypothetical protein
LLPSFVEKLGLKGQCHEVFDPQFFHQSIHPGPLIKGLKPFQIYIRIHEDIHIFKNACGVIKTACTKNFRTTSQSENHMQNSDGM